MQNSYRPGQDDIVHTGVSTSSGAHGVTRSMPLAVVAFDTQYRIQDFSEAWLALMADVTGRELHAESVLRSDYREEFELFLPLVHELERITKGELAEPWIFQAHQYECDEHWVNVKCGSWHAPDGSLCGSLATFYDVTSLSKPEQLLRMANEELIQFNYHVSHDLVAPISSARGLLSLIQSDFAAGELDELPEMLNEAQEQLLRLDQLVVDLMDLARADARTNEITEFNLPRLVDEISASQAIKHRESSLTINVECDMPEIVADRVRIQQILTNLLSNARKFVDPAESVPDITVRCTARNNETIIQVSDNGLGIDDNLASKLFGIFARGSSGHSGHGLGLYIVLKHAHHLGGTIKVTSYSKPTVFELRFPTFEPDQKTGS